MIETQKFKIVRNPMIPFKSVIEISDTGILNKKNMVNWSDIQTYSYGILVSGGGTNFIVKYKSKAGKKTRIVLTTLKGPGNKKYDTLENIYTAFDHGFREKVSSPRSREIIAHLKSGGEMDLLKCKLSKEGVVIRKGLIKKEDHFIKWSDVKLGYEFGGKFSIDSVDDKKASMYFSYLESDNCRLLEFVVYAMIEARSETKI